MSKSAISCLQEYCSRKRIALPVYNIENQSSPSQLSVFKSSCLCGEITTSATSSSKKSAKELSAKLMLEELSTGEPDLLQKTVKFFGNYVGELNEYCSQGGYPYPTYEFAEKIGNDFYVTCTYQEITTKGSATTKKDAKQNAANKMIQEIGIPSKTSNLTHVLPDIVCAELSCASATAAQKNKEVRFSCASAGLARKRKVLRIKFSPNTDNLTEYPCSKYVYTIKRYKVEYSIIELEKNPWVLELRFKKDNSYKWRATGLDRERVQEDLESVESLLMQPDAFLCRNLLTGPTYKCIEHYVPPNACDCKTKSAEATGSTKQTTMQNVTALTLKEVDGSNENLTDINYVGLLNEFCAKRDMNPPIYSEGNQNSEMILQNTFVQRCFCNDRTLEATGPNKKASKQNVAAKMLTYLKGIKEEETKEAFRNYVGQLNEYCVKYNWCLPKYSEVYNSGALEMLCTVELITTKGVGKNKKNAKHQSAANMLKILEQSVKNEFKESQCKDKLVMQNIECNVKSESQSKDEFGVECEKELEGTQCKKEIGKLHDISQNQTISDVKSESELKQHKESNDKFIVVQKIDCEEQLEGTQREIETNYDISQIESISDVKSESELKQHQESNDKFIVVQKLDSEEQLAVTQEAIEKLYDISQIESISDSDSYNDKVDPNDSDENHSPAKKMKK